MFVMQEDIVLCKVYRKATSLKVLEQRAAIEEVSRASHVSSSCPLTVDTPFYDQQSNFGNPLFCQDIVHKVEEVEIFEEEDNKAAASSLTAGFTIEKSSELQLPKFSMDWTMDSLWAQLRSPMLEIP